MKESRSLTLSIIEQVPEDNSFKLEQNESEMKYKIHTLISTLTHINIH